MPIKQAMIIDSPPTLRFDAPFPLPLLPPLPLPPSPPPAISLVEVELAAVVDGDVAPGASAVAAAGVEKDRVAETDSKDSEAAWESDA